MLKENRTRSRCSFVFLINRSLKSFPCSRKKRTKRIICGLVIAAVAVGICATVVTILMLRNKQDDSSTDSTTTPLVTIQSSTGTMTTQTTGISCK